MSALLAKPLDDTARTRALWVTFALGALGFGAFAAVGAHAWVFAAIAALLFVVPALTLPLPFVAFGLAALVPLQFFFEMPGAGVTLRGAVIFLFAAAARLLVRRATSGRLTRWDVWVLPAVSFLLVALVAAFGARERYAAFKGIYDWATIFLTAFVVSEIVAAPPLRRRLAGVLIAGGVFQAALGLGEYAAGSARVLHALRTPLAELFLQPHLLRERLADLTFNWVTFDRAAPFGTFINAIDYAIFLAAILSLTLALLLVSRAWARVVVLSGCAGVIGLALVLSLKGSGLLALAGGVAALAALYLWRYPARALTWLPIVLILAVVFALPFADLLTQRVTFLVEREMGVAGTVGRLAIWSNLIEYLGARLLFGYGLNNSIYLTEPTRIIRAGVAGLNPTSSENGLLAILIETGVVGFGVFALVWLAMAARAVRAVRRSVEPAVPIGVAAAMVAILLGNLTVVSFTTEQNGMLLGVLMGMISSCPRDAGEGVFG